MRCHGIHAVSNESCDLKKPKLQQLYEILVSFINSPREEKEAALPSSSRMKLQNVSTKVRQFRPLIRNLAKHSKTRRIQRTVSEVGLLGQTSDRKVYKWENQLLPRMKSRKPSRYLQLLESKVRENIVLVYQTVFLTDF